VYSEPNAAVKAALRAGEKRGTVQKTNGFFALDRKGRCNMPDRPMESDLPPDPPPTEEGGSSENSERNEMDEGNDPELQQRV
jgi:hypothetical protein